MKKALLPGLLVLLVIILLVLQQTLFVVNETQQALIVRFGDLRKAVQTAGLQWKLPFVDQVIYLEKRILSVETDQEELIAADQKRLVVDAFARYRITDPLLFYQSVRTILRGGNQIKTYLSASMRRVLGREPLFSLLSEKRAGLMQQIREQVDENARKLGIEVIDVRIRRADLPKANSEAIYRRMQAERKQQAEEIRAEGVEQAAIIRSRAEREVTELLAEAQRDSEIIRGTGDAEKNRIFAQAYSQDVDFFRFYRSMLAYSHALNDDDTRFILTPDSEFMRYFYHSGR